MLAGDLFGVCLNFPLFFENCDLISYIYDLTDEFCLIEGVLWLKIAVHAVYLSVDVLYY
jgi:hypothetical protein